MITKSEVKRKMFESAKKNQLMPTIGDAVEVFYELLNEETERIRLEILDNQTNSGLVPVSAINRIFGKGE